MLNASQMVVSRRFCDGTERGALWCGDPSSLRFPQDDRWGGGQDDPSSFHYLSALGYAQEDDRQAPGPCSALGSAGQAGR